MLCFEIRARYLDGNAAAGELSNIFTMDVTAAVGHCAHCGATKRFAEAHVYMQALTYLTLDTSRLLESGR